METIMLCPICNDPDASIHLNVEDHTVSHERFSIRQCGACGFQFTSPRPAQDRIGSYYFSDSYISHAEKASGIKDHIYHWVRKMAIRSKCRMIQQHHYSGNALDVGCGTGDFLAYLNQKGFVAQGVEVSSAAREAARAKEVPVSPALADVDPNTAFDVITLWHVLEHVPDPRTTLKDLFKRCSKGGLIVIAVPDNESWDCQHYGPLWAAWDVPRHLSHFRRKDIHRLLKEVGYSLVETKPMWFDAPYVCMLSEQYRGAGHFAAFLKGAAVGLWSNLAAMGSKHPTSSSLFLAIKP